MVKLSHAIEKAKNLESKTKRVSNLTNSRQECRKCQND